jgi:GABA permease
MSRVLVVANETVEADELLAEIRRIEDAATSEYLVLVPAHAVHEGHGHTWNQEGAIEAARERLQRTLEILASEGIVAAGHIGDMLPVAAIRDALMDFDATLIVISTHPEPRSRWLRSGLVETTRKKFGRPVVHVVAAKVPTTT